MNAHTRTHKLGFLLLSALLFTVTARAIDYVVLLDDDFASGVAGWVGNGNAFITHDAGNEELDAEQNWSFRPIYHNFPGKTLKKEGAWISFSYDVRLDSPVDASSLAFMTIIGNTAGDAYTFMINTGGVSGGDAVYDAYNFGGSATGALTSTLPPNAPEDTYFTVTGTIARAADPGQLLLSYSVNGTPIVTNLLANDYEGTMEFTYDRIAIGGRTIPTSPALPNGSLFYSLDNVRVWAIPEPASLTLALMIAGAALLRRRRG